MIRLVLAALVLVPAVGLADVRLDFANQAQEKSSVETAAGLVRVQQSGNDRVYMLFDQKQQTITVVNGADKSYQVITQQRIAQAAKKIADAKAKLRANFDKLSPEQQAQLQPVIERMAMAEARQHGVKKLSAAKVADIVCTEYEVAENDKATQKVCAANAKNLDISAVDYQAIADMLTMLAELSNKMGGGMMPTAISPAQINGVPIRTQELATANVTSLAGISRKKIAASRFAVPEGYQETQAP